MKGKLENGFEYTLDIEKMSSMEFIDALSEAEDGNPLSMSKACLMMLGKEQRKRLYDFIRNDEGIVPIEETMNCIVEMMTNSNNTEVKN